MIDVFEKIKFILNKQYSFHSDQIELKTKFYDELGTDSREMLELMSDFEDEFGIIIEFEAVEEIVTIEDAVKYIENQINLKNNY
jgi:acyl carrier protein